VCEAAPAGYSHSDGKGKRLFSLFSTDGLLRGGLIWSDGTEVRSLERFSLGVEAGGASCGGFVVELIWVVPRQVGVMAAPDEVADAPRTKVDVPAAPAEGANAEVVGTGVQKRSGH
jgi:hypothetical protein